MSFYLYRPHLRMVNGYWRVYYMNVINRVVSPPEELAYRHREQATQVGNNYAAALNRRLHP